MTQPPSPTDGHSPAGGPGGAPDRPEITSFLAARGADRMPHPGGTLLRHLIRVARLLNQWGAEPDVRVAGLCHASYGTAGFDQTLLNTTERPVLAELIGDRAEELVYLYAGCDRGVVYPRLSEARPVVFRDRFTGAEHTPPEPDIRAFLEITAANELDVLTHNAELARRHGPDLYGCSPGAVAGRAAGHPRRLVGPRHTGTRCLARPRPGAALPTRAPRPAGRSRLRARRPPHHRRPGPLSGTRRGGERSGWLLRRLPGRPRRLSARHLRLHRLATLLWRNSATAREHLSRNLTPDGRHFDLFTKTLKALADGGMHVTLA